MKHPLSSLSRLTALTITLSFSLALIAKESSGEDVSNSLANGATSALGTLTQGVGAYSNSATQLQMLGQQLNAALPLTGANTPQMAALNQVKMNLAMAMSEVQMCIQNGKKDTSKYLKGDILPSALGTTVPTCSNYGRLIDSLKKNADQISEANTKIACMKNFQSKVDQIAETAKTPFEQLTQAANKVWGTRDKIIKLHQNISNKLATDVDGKNGYREQMAKLEKLALDMNGTINGMGEELIQVQQLRVQVANGWYGSILQSTQSCYEGTKQKCIDGSSLTPAKCVERYIKMKSRNSPVASAQEGRNAEIFSSLSSLNNLALDNAAQQIEGNAKDQNGFIKIVDGRFNQMMSEITQDIEGAQFVGKNVNAGQLRAFVKDRYNACYNRAKQRFQSSMKSEGSNYKQGLDQVERAERKLATNATVQITAAKNAMTDFATSFSKVYNRDLSNFSSNCTASNNPDQSVDCLRRMQGILNSGLYGHPVKVKLNDGTETMVDAGTTAISIPNLALDAQGQPTSSATNVSCAGFKECVTVLVRARESHEKAEQDQTIAQEKFVEQHNSDMQTLVAGVGQSFATMSELITNAVTGINQDLTKAGASGFLKTKAAKGAALEKDDKTNLFKTPKSMKSAFAGSGSYTEIDDMEDAISGIKERRDELGKKFTEVAKVKTACLVTKADFSAIGRRLSCDNEDDACSDLGQMVDPLEKLLRKSQPIVKENEKDDLTKEYDRCVKNAEAALEKIEDAKAEIDEDLEIPVDRSGSEPTPPNDDATDGQVASYERRKEAYDQRKREYETKVANFKRAKQKNSKLDAKIKSKSKKTSGLDGCNKKAIAALNALADTSRGAPADASGSNSSLYSQNTKLLSAFADLAKACRSGDTDSNAGPDVKGEAVSACEAAKSAAESAQPPTDEGETKIDESGKAKSSEPTIKGAQ